MDVKEIKEYIYNNNKLEVVLEELGMHHIKWHNGDEYITCGMPDGDNQNSTTVYNDSYLGVIAYTRDIKDAYGVSDLISLVSFIKNSLFTQSINWLCDLFNLDYYSTNKTIDSSISYLNRINSLLKKQKNTFEMELKPISESILNQYLNWNNTVFFQDNINYKTQSEFGLRVDVISHRIIIPIRDELGNLVGIKRS